MRVLIAGGTGTIGRQLLRRLSEAGHEIFALVRSRKTDGILDRREPISSSPMC